MAQTQTSTAIIANMQTQERFFDHFEVEVWSQEPLGPPVQVNKSTYVNSVVTTQSTVSFSGGNTQGNTIVVVIAQIVLPSGSSYVTSVKDTFGNNYVRGASLNAGNGLGDQIDFWYASGVVGSSTQNVITVTISSGPFRLGVVALEYTGQVGGVDATATANTNGSTLSYTLTCAAANELIVNANVRHSGGITWSNLSGTDRTGLFSQFEVNDEISNIGSNTITANASSTVIGGASIAFLLPSVQPSSLVLGPYHVAGRWVQASGAWIQQDPLYVKGLTTGQTYLYRARVHIKAGGLPSVFTPFVTSQAGDADFPVAVYAPTDSVSSSGVVIQTNPTQTEVDLVGFEFFTNNTGANPASTQAPNLPSSTDGSVRLVLGDLDVASVWVRAYDTSGNRQSWTFVGSFNSNGALILSSFGSAGANLVNNPSFEKATNNYPTGLQLGNGQWLADGWVAASGSNVQFKMEVENGGPNPRTGQKNGHIQLSQSQAIASGTNISADLLWPGDAPNPGRSKLFPVRGGDYYYFGGWARWDAGLTLPGGVTGSVNLQLNFFDSNGNSVAGGGTTNSITSASGGYKFLNATVTVPVTAAFLQLDCNAQITTTSAAFNTGSTGIYMDARFDDVFIYKATRGSHGSYRPLTNPLTGHDAGSTATINIAAFTMRCGNTDLSISSGSITSLSYNTLYYIYYDDPEFVGGSEVFNATTIKETALQGEFRFFVGSCFTPRQGAPDTTGNNDGGSGSQYGNLNLIGFSLQQVLTPDGNGLVQAPLAAIDGDFTTYSLFSASGGATFNAAFQKFTAPPGLSKNYSSIKAKISWAITLNTISPVTGAQNTWTVIFQVGGVNGAGQQIEGLFGVVEYIGTTNGQGFTFTQRTDVVVLPPGTNLSQVFVIVFLDLGNGPQTGILFLRVYEIWIEAIE